MDASAYSKVDTSCAKRFFIIFWFPRCYEDSRYIQLDPPLLNYWLKLLKLIGGYCGT